MVVSGFPTQKHGHDTFYEAYSVCKILTVFKVVYPSFSCSVRFTDSCFGELQSQITCGPHKPWCGSTNSQRIRAIIASGCSVLRAPVAASRKVTQTGQPSPVPRGAHSTPRKLSCTHWTPFQPVARRMASCSPLVVM